MALTYFADTWYFIASLNPRDTHHQAARRLRGVIASARLETHDLVFSELLAFFADAGARARGLAAEAVRSAITDFRVVPASRDLFLRALTRYESRPDKEYSLVDCMSMVVMEERGIRHVLTNDHHFAQAGFVVVNR